MSYNQTAIGKLHRSNLPIVNQLTEKEWIPIPVVIDLYSYFDAMDVDPILVNAIKKCTKPGDRHQKGLIQDLKEAIGCIERKIEIEEAREFWNGK